MKLRYCSKKAIVLLFLLAILCGVADKGIHFFVIKVLNLPLFLDMIFCLALSFIHPVLGFVCALSGYAFSFIYETNMLAFLFSFCTFCGIITVWLFKKYVMDKNVSTAVMIFAEILILAIIICFVESISGGLVSRLIGRLSDAENYPTYQIDFFILMFHARIKSPLAVAIISRFPINIADRLISVPLSYLSYRGIAWMMKLKDR